MPQTTTPPTRLTQYYPSDTPPPWKIFLDPRMLYVHNQPYKSGLVFIMNMADSLNSSFCQYILSNMRYHGPRANGLIWRTSPIPPTPVSQLLVTRISQISQIFLFDSLFLHFLCFFLVEYFCRYVLLIANKQAMSNFEHCQSPRKIQSGSESTFRGILFGASLGFTLS